MLLGMGPLELLTLVIVATVVLGPDKLPRLIADAARIFRRIRTLADSTEADLRTQLGPEFANLELQDLHPRRVATKAWQHASADWELHELQEAATDAHSQVASALSPGSPAFSSQPDSRTRPPVREGIPHATGPGARPSLDKAHEDH